MQTEWKTNVLYKAAAIVGIGQTDWVDDHRKVRSGNAPFDSYGYAAAAFEAVAGVKEGRYSIGGEIPVNPSGRDRSAVGPRRGALAFFFLECKSEMR